MTEVSGKQEKQTDRESQTFHKIKKREKTKLNDIKYETKNRWRKTDR